MDDPCNTSAENQAKYLVPNRLAVPCAPRSAAIRQLRDHWHEIDTAVAFIRSLSGNPTLKVNLVGWSRGGMSVIGYAAVRADNVEKVVTLSPTRFPPAATVETYPTNITDSVIFSPFGISRSIPGIVRNKSTRRFARHCGSRRLSRTSSEAVGDQAFDLLPRSALLDGRRIFPAVSGRQRS
jgi:pimeloyl-ACP methyl ester carboxylesterase